ncbi:type II toxin-antitoxin system RelE/ParE family toxin [Spirulina sp. CCNP1310]|uniref:type II toxin-antitoxin system RelE/ParE family toxin n=1 Tax=Spirulina sp. CCNP1310 TaxID=3110249 RepID=UPI002B20A44C|nr:type II toxin-antitoxin system RelE/ParE family toxin [Spirulina sp. CCNP1310]MEA5420358.1 type II toxin-antitoxin system RelE/ParE family toxin [Spirulina sp. CCNP1310]
MRAYVISPPAIQDLQAVIDYFAKNNVEAGEKFLEQFTAWCQKLRQFPMIGKPYDGLSIGLRGVLIGEYILFYQVSEDVIEVVRVVYGKRDLIALFKPDD